MIFRLQGEIDALRRELDERLPRRALSIKAPEAPTSSSLVKYRSESDVDLLGRRRETPRDVESIDVSAEPVAAHTLEETERETIRRSLEANGGKRKATAQELNISERTLYRKIKEYGLE